MQPIIIPTINNNDTEVRLVEWLQADGKMVQPGDPLAVLETSKSTEELRAETAGLLQIITAAGQTHPYGDTIGRLFRDPAEREQFLQQGSVSVSTHSTNDLIITQAASELIQKHGLTQAQLRQLGKKIIKAKDLDPLIHKFAPAPSQRTLLSVHQLAVARVVALSHATIPQSFLVKKVYCDRALQFLSNYGQMEKIKVDLADLLVYCLSRQAAAFPFFFGTLQEDLQFTPSPTASGNIGVTFDLGAGLFIPVIKEASKLELKEIARKMMACRMKAMRRTFTADDLSGGDLTLSLNLDQDTVMVQPIIQAPQTCMVSAGSIQTEVVLDNENHPSQRRYLLLGVAFDHRIINGGDANQFLKAVKAQLENIT